MKQKNCLSFFLSIYKCEQNLKNVIQKVIIFYFETEKKDFFGILSFEFESKL